MLIILPECEISSFSTHTALKRAVIKIMGKTDELTVVQKTLGDSLNKEGKPLNVLAERAGCIKTFYAESRLKGKKCGVETVHKHHG